MLLLLDSHAFVWIPGLYLRQPLRLYQERQRCEMASPLDPFDIKYALGAEQARQHVMVGVSVVMTSIGGQSLHYSYLFVIS
jgi:hypothetical protein